DRACLVITCSTHQQHESVADGCTVLCPSVLPAHQAGGGALRDYAQLINQNRVRLEAGFIPAVPQTFSFQTPPRVAANPQEGVPRGRPGVPTPAIKQDRVRPRAGPSRAVPRTGSCRTPPTAAAKPVPGSAASGGES